MSGWPDLAWRSVHSQEAEGEMNAGAHLAFSFYVQFRTLPPGMVPALTGCISPPWLYLFGIIFTDMP